MFPPYMSSPLSPPAPAQASRNARESSDISPPPARTHRHTNAHLYNTQLSRRAMVSSCPPTSTGSRPGGSRPWKSALLPRGESFEGINNQDCSICTVQYPVYPGTRELFLPTVWLPILPLYPILISLSVLYMLDCPASARTSSVYPTIRTVLYLPGSICTELGELYTSTVLYHTNSQ